jgi:hypothetical protein
LFAIQKCRRISGPSSETGGQFLIHQSTRGYRMRKARHPRGQFDPDRLPAFFRAVGIDDPFLIFSLKIRLENIATVFWQQFNMPTVGAHNKEYQQYLRAREKARNLRHKWGPEQEQPLVAASILRANPDADLTNISTDVEGYKLSLSYLDKEEREHEADVKFAMTMSRDYRKKLTTKFLVEPVVRLLLEHDVTPSPRTMPIKRIAQTMFDLFGVAAAARVSVATVQKVWRREEASQQTRVQQQAKTDRRFRFQIQPARY